MKENRVRKVVAADRIAIGTLILEFATPGIAKLLEYADVDFATIDMEHGPFGIAEVAALIAAFKATDITPIVRVPDGSPHFISSVLDAGALGVQVANVGTAAEARAVAAAAKYPPQGERGIGLVAAHTDFRPVNALRYFEQANRDTLVVIQIESREGLDNIDEIAAVEGVDVLTIGFGDLSAALGIFGQLEHPLYHEATERVAAAAQRHGKIAKIHPHSDEQAARYVAQGYRMLMSPVDAALFRNAAKGSVDKLRAVAERPTRR